MKFLYQNTSLVNPKKLGANASSLVEYVSHLKDVAEAGGYEADESSINLPFDDSFYVDSSRFAEEKVTNTLKYILVVGIGGSNLGTKAVYDATHGYTDILEKDRFPKIIFVDTLDTEFLLRLEKFINFEIAEPAEIIVNIISKSGGTTETMANMEFVMGILIKKFGDSVLGRLVITTDFDSLLWKEAGNKNISRLGIPVKAGGRYSVFSNVGIFPLLCLGLDVKKLLEGAKEIRNKCLNEHFEDNPAMQSAIVLYENLKGGRVINDNFIFNSELESMGKWYRQLMGESLGKEKDLNGETINTGITPTISIGSTDLHSVGQLYLGGPKDKITTFIYSETIPKNVEVPNERIFPNVVEIISGKSMKHIIRAILDGVKASYGKGKLPFMEVVLDDISVHSLGQFMQFKMMEIMYLGRLMNVNAFDQPSVESYKTETKQILES